MCQSSLLTGEGEGGAKSYESEMPGPLEISQFTLLYGEVGVEVYMFTLKVSQPADP